MVSCYGIDASQEDRINKGPVRGRRIRRCKRIPFVRKAIPATSQKDASQCIIRYLILYTRQYGYMIAHIQGNWYADQDRCGEYQDKQLPMIHSIPVEHLKPQARWHKLVRRA